MSRETNLAPVQMQRHNMYPIASDSPRPSSVGSSQSYQSSSSKGGRGQSRNMDHDICVGEQVKIAVDIALERFRISEEQKELEFPSSLTSKERAYIHRLCDKMGLKHKSSGKGANRFLIVSKKDGIYQSQTHATFNPARNSRHQIATMLQRFPLTSKERQDLMPRTDRGMNADGVVKELNKTTTGRLNNGVPQVPPPRMTSDLDSFRLTLPVHQLAPGLVQTINDNKVVLISGETGSGKTTQVPQLILDDCVEKSRPCRIFCTQPRRLAALSVSERVAAERGEKIGQTVGYQIRLESRVSPKTLLTFCTNGVLLRTLMSGDNALSMVTHIIVDEIHERDRFSDFLLIALREVLYKFKNLKIVLMSAALNIQLFCNYFNGCPTIHIPGKLFDVQEFFLEDVLNLSNYSNSAMRKYKSEMTKVAEQQRSLEALVSQEVAAAAAAASGGEGAGDSGSLVDEGLGPEEGEDSSGGGGTAGSDRQAVELGKEKDELEDWVIEEMDKQMSEAWLSGNPDHFTQIFHLISSENVSVDYLHSGKGVTPLMVAAARGFFPAADQLLHLGASVTVRASNEWTALDWARRFERTDVVELLEAYQAATELPRRDDSVLVKQSGMASGAAMEPADRELLHTYHHTVDDEKVDIDLTLALLSYIHAGSIEGAILVFLPGYDEIVTLRDRLQDDKRFADSARYQLYTLHSCMQTVDQKKVFKPTPPGVRKIILSTNIAETSLTINDVVHVVDCGKVKEKSFDALSSVSMLKVHWISKASSLQRKGRAGRCRPGFCYHLFSRTRFESLQEYQDPELLRYPLQELCLHTKLLAPINTSIADFLAKAPEPPAFLITRNAVHILKQIDALDPFEDLTELGHHLADLPVEPKYGKMVLYSVVLKCLDPVLTIACTLAYKDPFLIPAAPYLRREAAMCRRKFAAGTFSDHMVLLRVFQGWQKAKMEGWERQFCEKNFVSSSSMEMIVGMRTQLLGQLRASGFVRARGGGDIRDLNTNSENWAVVKAALCAGMYPNIIRVNRARMILTTMKESKVRFHTNSVLSQAPNTVGAGESHTAAVQKLPTEWLIFEEMTRPRRLALVQCCTVVGPQTIFLFGGPAKMPHDAINEVEQSPPMLGQGDMYGDEPAEATSDSDPDEKGDYEPAVKHANLNLDEWITFKVDHEAAHLCLQLRQKWHSLFIRRMRAPAKPWSQVDESVIRAVVAVLTNEEQALGLQQPAGIGQRPRPMSAEIGVTSSSSGSRRGSCDTETSDDSSSANNGYQVPDPSKTPTRGRPFKIFSNSPKTKRDGKLRAGGGGGGRGANSGDTSASNSTHGAGSSSNDTSPCDSPEPAGSTSKLSGSSSGQQAGAASTNYYILKANTHKQLDLSYQRGVWPVSNTNEKKFSKALKDGRTVIVVFSVQGSGHFQGYAAVAEQTGTEHNRDFGCAHHSAAFTVEWIKKANLPFQQSHHLLNPWNENKRVQVSRDGQEVEPSVGEQLVHLWDKLPPPGARSAGSPQHHKMLPGQPGARGVASGYGPPPGFHGQTYRPYGGARSDSRAGDDIRGAGGRHYPGTSPGAYFQGGAGGHHPMQPPPHMGGYGPMYPSAAPPGAVGAGLPHGGAGGGGMNYGGQNPVMILQRGTGAGQNHPQARSGGAQYYKTGK